MPPWSKSPPQDDSGSWFALLVVANMEQWLDPQSMEITDAFIVAVEVVATPTAKEKRSGLQPNLQK